jgi:apolipoprotein N-acyltransferase
VISPAGTIAAAIPVKTQQVLTATVPLLEVRTLASRIGFAFPAVCGVALAGLCLRGMQWRRRDADAADGREP